MTVVISPREPKFTRIADGLMAQVVERKSRIPARLDALLMAITVTERLPVRLLGTPTRCTDADHMWAVWIRGVYNAMELTLRACPGCGAVEVRDVSMDLLPGLRTGRSKPRRKSDILGWYSGKRPAGRVYL